MTFPIDIRQFLPHRAPMLMVNNISKMDESTVHTDFLITDNNIFIENGMLLEIGLLENAAQTCSGIVGRPQFEKQNFNQNYTIQGFISKINHFEVFSLPKVGEKLLTKGKLLAQHSIGTIINCEMQCSTFANNRLLAEGTFNLILQP